MIFNLDSAIFIGFLIATVGLGLFSSYGIKNLREYAVGDRNFSTATIAATIIATWASGQAFFTILAETYGSGLYFIWSVLGYILCLLSIGIFFAPRMGEFLGKLSIAEAMGDLFGKEVRIITSVSGFVASGGMIALQLKVSGFLFEYCFNIPEVYGIFIGGVIVTIYSSLGGIKSVTFTDVIQLFTFSAMIPALALFILGTLDNIDVLINTLTTNELFDYNQVFDFSRPKSVYFIFLFLFNAIPAFNPAFFQRIAMAKNTTQISRSFIIAAFTCLFITLTISFISVLILSTNPNLNTNDLTKHILFNYSYPGLNGFILAGIMAMVLSTADSYINSTSILFVNDFCHPLGIGIVKNKLFFSRIASALLGVISIILALRSGSLLESIIAANMFYMPLVTVPFILATLGFRSSSKSVLIGMLAGFLAVIVWEKFFKSENIGIDGLIPGMLANLIFLISSHYLLKQKGGWVGIKDNTSLKKIRYLRKAKINSIINSIRNFNFVTFIRKNSPSTEAVYVYFGLFCVISLYSTISTIPADIRSLYSALINFVSPSVLFSATALLSYPLWPALWKKTPLICLLWNIVAFYVLICVGFLFVIISNFAPLQVMILMINLILISVLVRWQWALFMIIAGFVTITQFLNFYSGSEIFLESTISLRLKVIYLLLLVSSTLIIFFKPKQEYIEATEHKVDTLETEVTHLGHEVINLNEQVTHYSERVSDQAKEIERLGATAQKILNNVNHELRLPIGNVVNFSDMLHEALQKTDNKLIRELSKEVYDNSNRISTMILNMLDLATLDVKKVDLQKTTINFSELVSDRVKTCRKIYLGNKKIDFELMIDPEVMISVDPNYIRQTVDNLVINAINFSTEGLIEVSVSKQKDQVIFTITDQGKGIPPLELSDIFTPFKMGSNSESKAEGRGVGLALCKSAVEAHGGFIKAESDGKVGAKVTFILPL